jgi:hypothetical protein
VEPSESGLASGIVNTAFMMGGAVGLAVLASVAAARTDALQASQGTVAALNSGYHLAFLTGAVFAAVAALFGASFLRANGQQNNAHAEAAAE